MNRLKNLFFGVVSTLLLLACAATQSTQPISTNTDPSPSASHSEISGWEEINSQTDFLPVRKAWSKDSIYAEFIALKSNGREGIYIDTLLTDLQQFYNRSFDRVDGFSKLKMKIGQTDGVFWQVNGFLNNKSFAQAGFYYETQNNIFHLYLETEKATNDLKKEIEELLINLPAQQKKLNNPNSEKSLSLINSYGLQLPELKGWQSINDDENAIIDLQKETHRLSIYGHFDTQNIATPTQVYDAYLALLGISVQSQGFDFKREKDSNGLNYISFNAPVENTDKILIGRYYELENNPLLFVYELPSTEYTQSRTAISNLLNTFKINLSQRNPLPENDFREAYLLNAIGLQNLLEKKELIALAFFEKANKLDPENPVYLINCGYVYQEKKLHGPGIKHYENQLELVSKDGRLLKILGEMYEHVKEFSKANQVNNEAFLFRPFDIELNINRSDALWGLGRKMESLMAIKSLYAFKPDMRLGIYLAKTYMGLEQYQEGATLLSEIRESYGLNEEIGKFSMIAYLFLQRYEDALAIAKSLMNEQTLDQELLVLKGKSEFYLKRFKDALTTFEEAQKIRDDMEIQSFLAATRSFLGIGNNKSISTPISAVQTIANPKDVYDSKLESDFYPQKFPALWHFRSETLEYKKNSRWTLTEEFLIEVKNEKGVSDYKEFTFAFIPGYDRIYINHLNILDKNFKLKAKGNPKKHYVSSDYGANASTDVQLAHILTPDLQVGDFIHLQVSRTSIEKAAFAPYVHHQMSRTLPVGKDLFKIVGDTTGITVEIYGDLERQNKQDGEIVFEKTRPNIIHNELYAPHYQDIGTGVLISQARNWSSVGKEYENLIRPQFKNAIAVQEKAYEIRGNSIKTDKIIQDLIFWIRQNVVYEHIPFGDRSLIPVTALTTMKNRKGDCKDQALLLQEMLNTFKIPSHLTLMHLAAPISPALPSLQQFNHMILYIPAGKDYPEQYVDLTEKGSTDRVIPYHLEGKYALIIDGDSSKLVITPKVDNSEEHWAEFHHTAALSGNRVLQIQDSLVLSGKFGVAFRDKFYGLTPDQQRVMIRDWISFDVPEADVQRVQVIALHEHEKPLILKIDYSIPNLFYEQDGLLIGKIPNVWERSFMRLPRLRKRHHPIRLPHEMHFKSTFTVQKGKWAKLDIKEPVFNPDRFYTDAKSNTNQTPDKSFIEMNWVTNALYADPEEYIIVQKEWQELVDGTLLEVGFEK